MTDVLQEPKKMDVDMKVLAAKSGGIKKVGICIPMRGMIEAGFVNNFVRIMMWFMRQPNTLPVPIFSDGLPLDKARNDCVKSGEIARCDYYFWLDSDVYLNEVGLSTMWHFLNSSEDRHIVSGIYYEKMPPFNPVIRKADSLGRFIPICEVPKQPFKIYGAGFGCVLMKREPMDAMFNAHKGRVFQFLPDISEDLFFCKEVQKLTAKNGKRFEIWCHPNVQCSHYGGFVQEWNHLHYKLDEYSDISELAAYLKLDRRTVLQKCTDAAYDIANRWTETFKAYKPGDDIPDELIDEFYKKLDLYLYDLTYYWSRDKRGKTEVLSRIRESDTRILDYGCGIGDYGLNILESRPNTTTQVTFYDINEPNQAYLKWRIEQRVKEDPPFFSPEQAIVTNNVKDLEGKKYDTIICMDVLEHVADPALHAKRIYDLLDRNGVLLAFVAPKSKFQPMHISEYKLEDAGFVQVSDYVYVRADSDTGAIVKQITK